jgi:ABC-type transport system substrate-binding protein
MSWRPMRAQSSFAGEVLFPGAGVLSNVGTYGNGGFQPLPRHILEQSFRQDPPDTFANQLYWSSQYVGLGPYKLERWEPGAFVEGSAFDGHVLGRPKIDRILVRFIADENTVLANLLSETVHPGDGPLDSFRAHPNHAA